ncbi:MAG: hypothetical protein ACFB0C_05890 [Leptolyngbyaceae cyanobacterium]
MGLSVLPACPSHILEDSGGFEGDLADKTTAKVYRYRVGWGFTMSCQGLKIELSHCWRRIGRVHVLIPAAGMGRRMGSDRN